MKIQTEHGEVNISSDVIAKIAGLATTECYGVVGMASQKQVKDGISELLGKNNLEKGIVIKENEENAIQVEVHVVIAFGIRISEVANGIQSKVKHDLQEALGVEVSYVDICVDGVKTIDLK